MREARLPTALSPSSMSLFIECPRRYEEEKIKGNRSYPGKEAVLGTFVHRILELLMSKDPDERTLDNAWICAREAWAETVVHPDFIRLGLSEDAQKMFRWDARTSIENYFELEHPPSVNVVSTEQNIECVANDVPLRGIIDRVEMIGDDLVVSDYKNGKVTDQKYMAPKVAQLNLYAAMLRELNGSLPNRARLIYTAHKEIAEVEISDASVDEVLGGAKEVWTEVQDSFMHGSFRPNVGPLCGWCDAVERCPEGLSHVSNLFSQGRLKSHAPAYKLMTTPRIIPFPKMRKTKGHF